LTGRILQFQATPAMPARLFVSAAAIRPPSCRAVVVGGVVVVIDEIPAGPI